MRKSPQKVLHKNLPDYTAWHSLCPSVFSPQPLYVRLQRLQRHFTHGRTPTAKYSFLCQRVSREMNLHRLFWTQSWQATYHMICLINGPHQQHCMATGTLHFRVDGKEWVCLCVCESWLCSCDWRLQRDTTEGFKAHSSLSRWITDDFYSLQNTKQISAGEIQTSNTPVSLSCLYKKLQLYFIVLSQCF